MSKTFKDSRRVKNIAAVRMIANAGTGVGTGRDEYRKSRADTYVRKEALRRAQQEELLSEADITVGVAHTLI